MWGKKANINNYIYNNVIDNIFYENTIKISNVEKIRK